MWLPRRESRIGRFEIDADMDYEVASKAFADMGFVATRAECLYHSLKMDYIGISKAFREVGKGGEIPSYRITITTDPGTGEYKSVSVEEYQ